MQSKRDTVLELKSEGKSCKEIAEILKISLPLVSYYLTPEDTLILKKSKRNKEKASEATQKIKQRNRAIVTEYLNTHPCVDCGITDIRVLQFDHVRGTKIDSVSVGVKDSWSVIKLQAEIEKCEVRCANCHKIVTDTRRLKVNQ
jgi:predicted transcriptional regulator